MDASVNDLSEWMTQLPKNVREIPLINLAIPGEMIEI